MAPSTSRSTVGGLNEALVANASPRLSAPVSARDFFREGIWLNPVGAILTTLAVLTFGRLVLPL